MSPTTNLPARLARLPNISKSTTFPFNNLSAELALEVIHFAATPDFADPAPNPPNPYQTAVNLCLVSHVIRRAAIPHLLHTVILSVGEHVHAFISAILLQRSYRQNRSRLEVGYTTLVKRMWCGTCWEALVDCPSDDPWWLDYDALWSVMRNVEDLGINYQSAHLLYNSLATDYYKEYDSMNDDRDEKSPSSRWRCRRVTFAGEVWRWKPITSTPEGSAFLANIEQLSLWMPDGYHEPHPRLPKSDFIPLWMTTAPLDMMHSLTDLAFVLSRPEAPMPKGEVYGPTQMLVYHAERGEVNLDLSTFKRWAVNDKEPIRHGVIIPFYVQKKDDKAHGQIMEWESAWKMGQGDLSSSRLQREAKVAAAGASSNS